MPALAEVWVQQSVPSVHLYVCQHIKRKIARAINTQVSRHNAWQWLGMQWPSTSNKQKIWGQIPQIPYPLDALPDTKPTVQSHQENDNKMPNTEFNNFTLYSVSSHIDVAKHLHESGWESLCKSVSRSRNTFNMKSQRNPLHYICNDGT